MLGYTQSNHRGALKCVVAQTLPLREKINHEMATSRSPFVKPGVLLQLKKALFLQILTFFEFIFGESVYVHNDKSLLYQLSPETRSLLSWLTRNNVLESWTFCSVSPGVPDVKILALRPCAIEEPSGNGFLFLDGANGVGTADTYEAAAKPALGEFVERLASAGFWWDDSQVFSAAYNQRDQRMLHPESFQFLLPDQMIGHTREQRFSSNFDYHTKPIRWIPARDITGNKRVFIPAALCYTFSEYGMLDDMFYPEVNSNGVAAHTNVTEAANRALIEYIERDILMRAWYHKRVGCRISLETLSPFFPEVQAITKSVDAGTRTYLIDLTDELEVPTIVGVQLSTNPEVRTLVFTAASDLSYKDAVQKVLTEMIRFMNVDSYAPDAPPMPETPEEMQSLAHSFKGRGGLWSHTEMFRHIEWFVSGEEVSYESLLASLPVLNNELSYVERQRYLTEVCSRHALQVYFVHFKNTIARYAGLHVVRAVTTDLVPVFFDEKHIPKAHKRFTHDVSSNTIELNPIPHPYL